MKRLIGATAFVVSLALAAGVWAQAPAATDSATQADEAASSRETPAETRTLIGATTLEAETLLGTMDMADQMVLTLRGASGLIGRRIAVLPFFDLNDLQMTSDLGRLVGEELAAALHFRNFHLAEIRTDDQLILARRAGESYLTRTGPDRSRAAVSAALDQLREKYNLGGLVVGTYSALPAGQGNNFFGWRTEGKVSLNARLIDTLSGAVLAMGTAKIALNESIQALLARRSSTLPPPAMEEIKAKRF